MIFSVVQLKSHTSLIMDKLQNEGFNCHKHNDMCFNVTLGPNKIVKIVYMGVGYNLTIAAINLQSFMTHIQN